MFSASTVTCEFELMRPTRIFYSGDQVCGKITLTALKKFELQGILLDIVGSERIEWSEYAKNMPILYDDSSTHNTTDNKIYLKGSKEYVLASVQLSDGIILEPGEFIAHFNLNLPDQLLATCKQSNGHVDYHLQVVLQRKTVGQKFFRKRLFLRNRLDLNMEPKLAKDRKITFLLQDNELIFMIPHTGFVPGQLIPFSITMTQLLNKAKIVINLCQKISYASQTPTSKLKEVIKVHDYQIVTTTGSSLLRVPFSTAISTTLDDVLMKISYYVELLVLNEQLQVIKKTMIPITVGTVALKDIKQYPSEKSQRLHSYDNLGVTREELDERRQHNLVNFDFIVCEPPKCFRCIKSHSLITRKKSLRNFCTKLYGKLISSN